VDEAWHAQHILCTKNYRRFCDDVFWEYLDHTPGNDGFNWIHYDDTMSRYEKRFVDLRSSPVMIG
jgi:hypothetical protein